MRSRLKPLITLLYNPSRALAEIAAAAPYVFGAILALLATFLYRDILSRALLQSFSAMNNRAVRDEAQGEYICLLNNDTAILDDGWLGEMIEHARRPEVGIVGAKLSFPDSRIQHGGDCDAGPLRYWQAAKRN